MVLSAACIARRYVSKATAGSSKSAGDRLFFFLNGRPIDLPKVRKLCNTQQPTGGTSSVRVTVDVTPSCMCWQASRVVTDMYRALSSAATAHCRPVAILDLNLARHRRALSPRMYAC